MFVLFGHARAKDSPSRYLSAPKSGALSRRRFLECGSPLPLSYGQQANCGENLMLTRLDAPVKAPEDWAHSETLSYLLPGFTAGILARSAGNWSAANVSTCSRIRLNRGTPRSTVPSDRSTSMATPTTTA